MPDVANRQTKERRIAKAIQKCRDDQKDELRELLGPSPNLDEVPQEFWDKAEECEKTSLLPFLTILFLASSKPLSDSLGLETVEPETADLFAARRASEVAKQAVARSRKLLGDSIEQTLDAGRRFGDEDFELPFGRHRARAEGRVEVPVANSAGEAHFMAKAREGGREVKTIWRVDWPFRHKTSHCPICIGLDKSGEAKWARLAPNGPPLHPHCCCYIDIIVDGKLTQSRFRGGN